MARSVLDRTGWSAEALERAARFEAEAEAFKARKRAAEAHPLYGCLEGVTDEALRVSTAERFRIVARDLGNGHREAVVCKMIPNVERTLERAITPRGEGDREQSAEAASRRAKQRVRHLCKAMGVNALWTLTYRENVTDRELVLRHLDAFRRRVVRLLGDLRYVAVLEPQERGAWHIHMGTHKLPRTFKVNGQDVKSFNVLRAIWRSVVGNLGGNFDQARRKRRFGSVTEFRSAASIARYIAAYVGKEFMSAEFNRKRYSASKGVEIPPAYRAELGCDEGWIALIELAYAAVGDRITSSWFDAERGVFFIESDDGPPVG